MGSSLKLQKITETDTDFIVNLGADPRVTAHIGDGKPWSREYSTQRVTLAMQSTDISWFIVWQDHVRLGLFTATRRTHATEIGYWLAPDFWGQGLAKLIVSRGIEELHEMGCTDLIARVAPENLASLKILERHGFIAQSQDDSIITLTKATPQL
ncbi:GNAT family N-acetyltransferase [Glutamicibacter sp.]|uniref:GNAT family N-acetyltransferase n=1 Tax=Glutamicibacter sp. TaxID=1931995 RepID=UPI002FE2FC57